MQNTKTLKSMPRHASTQFELTSNLLRNLHKFDLTPVTKLVLLELTTHLNSDKNGSVVFPSVNYIAEVLGIGLTATKKAINDLINEGLIIKSKRSKVQGNYNKYLITPKVQNLTSEQSENECFKKSDNDLLLITNNFEQKNEQQCVEDYKILVSYAKERGAKNVNAYVNALKVSGGAQQIIQQHKSMTQRYDTGETKRIEKIMNEEIAPMPQEFFSNYRSKLAAQCS